VAKQSPTSATAEHLFTFLAFLFVQHTIKEQIVTFFVFQHAPQSCTLTLLWLPYVIGQAIIFLPAVSIFFLLLLYGRPM